MERREELICLDDQAAINGRKRWTVCLRGRRSGRGVAWKISERIYSTGPDTMFNCDEVQPAPTKKTVHRQVDAGITCNSTCAVATLKLKIGHCKNKTSTSMTFGTSWSSPPPPEPPLPFGEVRRRKISGIAGIGRQRVEIPSNLWGLKYCTRAADLS